MKPMNMSQKWIFAEALVVHPAGDLGEPVVGPGEDPEDGAAEEHVVEVRDDVVGVVRLVVDREGREQDPGEPAHREEGDEAEAEEQRRPELRWPLQSVASQLKILIAVGTATAKDVTMNHASASRAGRP